MPTPDIAAVFRQPFAEQVAFFRGKLGNLVPTQAWNDIERAAHDTGFMVAGAAKADLLADLAAAVDKVIAEGETLQAFRQRFAELVERNGWHGWTGEATAKGRAWRTRVIYQTNLATSYAAGRLAQLKAGGYTHWMYRHSDSVTHPRPHHLAMDGVVRPADDPFWRIWYPPNGWGCKCHVVGVRSPEMARRLGGDPDKPLPGWWNERDSKGRVPGIDEGWDYMPGGTVNRLEDTLVKKTRSLPQVLRDEATDAVRSARSQSLRKRLEDVAAIDRMRIVRDYIELHVRDAGEVAVHGMSALERMIAVRFDGVDWLAPDVDLLARQIELHARAKMMDYGLRRHAQRVVITRQANKHDDFWRERDKNFTFAAATAGERQVTIYRSGPVGDHVIAHEYGHLLAESISGSALTVPLEFMEASRLDGFVTDYARDMFGITGYCENFAEACSYWQTNQSFLKRNYPNIYRVVDGIIRRARGGRWSS